MHKLLSLTLAAAICAAAPSAFAQQPQKTAAELRAEAKTALDENRTADACVLYEQAYQASKQAPPDDPGPRPNEILFDLADCHEKQGYNQLAAGEFEQVANAGGDNADQAKARLARLKQTEGPATPPEPKLDPAAPNDAPAEKQPQPDEKGAEPRAEEDESPTRIGDFMDTRLTWVIGDDDVLKQTGQAFPLSPNVSIGDRRQYRLF